MKLILEQRYLFDGSVGAVGHHVSATGNHDALHPFHHAPAIAATEAASAPLAGSNETNRARATVETVLIVDPSVANWQELVAGAKPGVDVVVLNPAEDAISQVTQALQGLAGVRNLEFLTDGTPGSITLGGTTLNLATLTERSADIAGWSASLSAHADIIFWGCDVGQGSAGAAFVNDMHTLTGATIGASSDATGSAALGGDWTLEVTTGALHSDANAFTATALAGYTGVLDTPVPTVTLSVSDSTSSHVAANTILLGDSMSVNMTFSNTAANATGYGPYVELFAPTALTLSGVSSGTALSATVTYNGTTATFTNPLTNQVETAPSGITGGSVYFMTLPYGSFTVGEPAVSISATLTSGTNPSLIGSTLDITARGGFEYGAVATGGAPIVGSDLPVTPETVELIESWVTVATQPDENETATGPDFPVTYTVSVEAAPAVASLNEPITNLSTLIELPAGVIAASTVTASGSGTGWITSAPGSGGTVQTLHIDYASLSGTQTATFSAYVPEDYQYTSSAGTAGAPILDPTSGAAVTIAMPSDYSFTADTWYGGSHTWSGVSPNGSGDVSAAWFEAKSLAVQLTADTGSALPGQDIGYSLNFEVSDYFGVSGLQLTATLGNGLQFDPTVAPQLSVTTGGVKTTASLGTPTTSTTFPTANGETVNATGSGAGYTYVFDTSTNTKTDPTAGQTNISFNAGALIPGLYGAGSTGSLTFSGQVLVAYPTGSDNVSGAGGFLRETDSVSTVGSGEASFLYDYATTPGVYTLPTGDTISDDTSVQTDTLPSGSLTLSIVAVEDQGTWYSSGTHLQDIAPGDTVVYQLQYTLQAPGGMAGLSMTAYLPEPVFSVANPPQPDTSDYTGTKGSPPATGFSFNSSAATATDLVSGQYNFTTSYTGTPNFTVGSATTSEPSNGVTFNIVATTSGNPPYLNPNAGTQTVTIDFAVTASSLPFLNGLALTAQGDSSYTPAAAPIFTQQVIHGVAMSEPLLLDIQQGIASVADDAGNPDTSVTWTNGADGSTASAPTIFSLAGSGSVFAGGAIPAALTASVDNLNVSGVQAGDTVRVVDAVQNSGNYAAYDVIVKDALSPAFTTANVSNLTFTLADGTTTLTAINPLTGKSFATTTDMVNAFFSASGVMLTAGGLTSNAVLSAAGSSGDMVYITYDIKVPAGTPTAASLTGEATLLAWTNADIYNNVGGTSYTLTVPGTTSADGNFADASAVGASATTLSDTATIATLAPSVTDQITGVGDASDAGATIPSNTFPNHATTLVPGETADLSATISLPQGTTNQLSLTDILPAGMTLISTAGSYSVTYTSNAGVVSPLSATIDGNTLSFGSASFTEAVASGGDKAGTITFNYQALVAGTGTTVDTSSWGTNAAAHNGTLTDTFATGNNEGISYQTTTENVTETTVSNGTGYESGQTQTTDTNGTGNASGQTNTVTVANPLVVASFTETGGTSGQNVYSGEVVTYQLTLTNESGAAVAYDLGSNLTLPAGLTYDPTNPNEVLKETSSTGTVNVQQVNPNEVGTGGTAAGLNAVDGITLGAGASVTFTFGATVNQNLPAGTALTLTAKPEWTSLPDNATFDGAGNVNSSAQAYTGAQASVSNSVANIAVGIGIVGTSNDTAGPGDTTLGQTATVFETAASPVNVTQDEIVRVRAVLQVPEGENSNSQLVVNLPSGLTYANDGDATVLLVSPQGDLTSTPPSTPLSSSPNLSATSNSANPSTLGLGLGSGDPVLATLNSQDISTAAGANNSTDVAIHLGTLQNNDAVSQTNYVVVEFNAVVSPTLSSGTLAVTDNASVTGQTAQGPTDTLSVVAPNVTLTKTITGIQNNTGGSMTVTYTDVVTNNGTSPAYNVSLDDPGAGGYGAVTLGTETTGGTLLSTGAFAKSGSSPNTSVTASLAALPAGGSETLTYSINIPSADLPAAVAASANPATVTSYALNPADYSTAPVAGLESLAGTTLTPPSSSTTASAGLDFVSGTVNQDVSPDGSHPTSALDSLSGQTIAVTFTGENSGIPDTTTTDSSGDYTILVPTASTSGSATTPVAVTITATTLAPPASTFDTLDNGSQFGVLPSASVTGGTGSGQGSVTFDPASGASYTSVTFDFWRAADTAPVLTAGAVTSFTTTANQQVNPFAGATVSDTQLDAPTTSGGGSGDYSGVTLHVARTDGTTLTPDASDAFSGSNGLTLSGGNVSLNGTPIGSYDLTTTPGELVIKFGAGATASTIQTVLADIGYTNTQGTQPGTSIRIGATIDDANSDPFALNGNSLDPSGPHDQGVGGDMWSNLLVANVTANVPAPQLSIIGDSNNDNGQGTQETFDPRATANATVGDIVRMRAEVQLPEGTSNGTTMTITLPNGLIMDPNWATDGSVTVLIASPSGAATASDATVAGAQGADGKYTMSSLNLNGTSDPVSTPLTSTTEVQVSGNQVTFSLGNLGFTGNAAGQNYAIVEFNTLVSTSPKTASNSPLNTTLVAAANGTNTSTVSDNVTVVAPDVSIAKTIDGITYNPDGSVTVSYTDTVTNGGDAPAYNLQVTDLGASVGSVTYTGTSGTSGSTVTSAEQSASNASEFSATMSKLAAGGTQSFTYTVNAPASDFASGITDANATATVTDTALNPVSQTLAGTTVNPAPYSDSAAAGLDVASGYVKQDTSPTPGTSNPSLVPLGSQTISVTFLGQTGTESVSTGADGGFSVLLPDNATSVTITSSVTSPNGPTNDTIDNTIALQNSVPGGTASGTNPVALTFAPATNTSNTNYAGINFDYWVAPDTAPVLSGGSSTPLTETIGEAITPFGGASVTDHELATSFGSDFSGTTLTIQRYVNGTAAPDATDSFGSASGYLAIGGAVVVGNATVGHYTESGGLLTIKFASTNVTASTVDQVLDSITYTSNLTGHVLVPGVVIGAQIDDANNDPISLNGDALDRSGPHDQGVGGDMLSNVLTATVDISGTQQSNTFIEPNDANPALSAVPVAAGIDLTDIVNTAGTPSKVTLTIAGVLPEDVLAFTNTSDITGAYANGTMTLTAVSGKTPTVAEWQAAIQAVDYYDTSAVPYTSTRQIAITVTSGVNTAEVTNTMAIVPTDDSPILNTSITPTLNDSTEYQGTGTPTPSGAVGTLVSQLVGLGGTGPGNVTDTDGPGLTNGATPTAPGIAITGVNTTDAGGTSVGTWYYSTNNGATWTAFPTTISATAPLDLSSTARIAFEPTATNFNGQIPNAITFRAWDGFDGTASGSQANLSGVTVFGQSAANNAPATAYSIATETLPLMVDNVNNAPTATGSADLPDVNVAEQHPPGETVAQLFGPGFADKADQQYLPTANPAGSTANGMAGIAITGNAAPSSHGTWEYSLNGGTTWVAIPTNLSQDNALILPASAKIAFLPNGSYSGHPGDLTVNLIDSSTATVAPGLTGAQLAAENAPGGTPAAVSNVEIPAIGGSTAFSATTMTLDTTVLPMSPNLPAPQPSPGPGPQGNFPDDNVNDPTGGQFWTTDDWMHRPLIPDLSLVGSVADRFIIVEQHAVIQVPSNIFWDSLPQPNLTFEAKRPDGTALPSWITFNPGDLTFSGTPPLDSYGRLEITIKARDVAGNTAEASFNLLIGRDYIDLVGLLNPSRHHHHARQGQHAETPAAGLREAADTMAHADPSAVHRTHVADRVAARAEMLAAMPAWTPVSGGFSTALHAAGPMTALGRARALLDNLNDMLTQRPAA